MGERSLGVPTLLGAMRLWHGTLLAVPYVAFPFVLENLSNSATLRHAF